MMTMMNNGYLVFVENRKVIVIALTKTVNKITIELEVFSNEKRD